MFRIKPRVSVCLAALPHNLYSFQFLDAYPSKLRKSLLNDKKWYNILAIIHILNTLFAFCVFIQTVQGINIVYLCLKHLQMCFLFNMAAASEQSFFSRCCMMKHSLWWHEDQSNPDFTHASDDTHMKIFFFHIWATWWILNGYRTAEDAKILTRCEGRDLQIIRLKQGWGVLPLNLVFVSRASQCGWLSGRAGADVALVAVEEAVSYSDIRPCGCVT